MLLDGTHPKDRMIASAMELAKTRPWREISLLEIATHAGIPLIEARKDFQSKAQILAAFTRAIDKSVLEDFPKLAAEPTRDRLFDVILTRFEIMQPYKGALANITDELKLDVGAGLSQLRPALQSQYWMLAAAGLSGEGGMGLLRIKGLLSVYARVFHVWLEDDDAGLAKTMAALDKHLRQGESVLARVSSLRNGLERVCAAVTGKRTKEEVPQAVPEAAASSTPREEPSPSI